MAVQIPLTRGMVAVIDDADAELARQYKWYAHKRRGMYYAATNQQLPDGRRITISLHRLIIGAAEGVLVDHHDNDTMNNRRGNLRFCSRGQNKQNSSRVTVGSSQYKGVEYRGDHLAKPWGARIRINGRQRRLGSYTTELEAAVAYDAHARRYFGEFARTNF